MVQVPLAAPDLDAPLKELLEKRAALEARLGLTTEDSIQFGGEGSVIGSAAAGDIITGSDNEIDEAAEDE